MRFNTGHESRAAMVEFPKYRNNIIASYCLCASYLVPFRDQKPGTFTMLVGFFSKSTSGVTPDTRRVLAEALLKLVGTDPVGGDADRVTALSRAAAVLPAWQFPTTALKMNLTGIGETEAAKQLKALVDRATKVNEERQKQKK